MNAIAKVGCCVYGTKSSGAGSRSSASCRMSATVPTISLQGAGGGPKAMCWPRSEEHTSELQSRLHLVCRLLLEKKKKTHLQAALPQHLYMHQSHPILTLTIIHLSSHSPRVLAPHTLIRFYVSVHA